MAQMIADVLQREPSGDQAGGTGMPQAMWPVVGGFYPERL
jgi:hypothetical protein